MISGYDIRENSFTQNSVYVLLVKGDEKGREDIEREFADHCKLIDAKFPGFNYVFELLDIKEQSSLEKIRTKLEKISFGGVTQTFGNSSRTMTIDISTQSPKERKTAESTSISLAETGFPVSIEQNTETNFKDLVTNGPIVSEGEQRIDIGNTSLELAKTIPSMNNKTPKSAAEEIYQKLSGKEQTKETIRPYSPGDIKTEMEKEKTGLFGNIFGKFKTAIHTKKEQKEKTFLSQKSSSLSNENKEKVLKNINNNLKKEVPGNNQSVNPFQNLGEGLIVKKSLLEEETFSNTIKGEKENITTNPLTAKIQVDDIFAAETVCDFYANQSEGEIKNAETVFEEEKTPLQILENQGNKKEEKVKNTVFVKKKEETIKIAPTEETIKNSPDDIKQEEADITLPDQLFTNGNLESKTKNIVEQKKEKEVIVEQVNKKEDIRKQNNIVKEDSEEKQNKIDEHQKHFSKVNVGEVNKNMKEENKEIPAVSKPKEQNKPLNETAQVKNNEIKKGMKIDHTLHVATPSKDTKYRNYPIEMPLVPTNTFANMDISSIRFAHAMAMATLDDLGKSNNPFLIQGGSGTGKTHFLHAMGYEVSKKIPQSKILFTNGVRFSRGVQYLLEKGQKEKLDAFFNNAEVLIIDDVHLTAVNEHNREYISKVLNDFLKNKKQILLSSKYPPESLKRFEELVNFKFSLGTVAELKVPSKAHFEKLTNRIVTSSFLDLTENQVKNFFSERNSSLGDVARNVKRVKVLSRRIESSGIKKMSYEEILKEMTGANGENTESPIVTKDFEEITALERNSENSWGNFGFFFPASQIDKFRWVAFAAQEAAKSLGIKGGFNYALKSAYSTDHIISAAFKIANICDLKGLKGAVILGPAFTECKEPIRDNFYDILTHMLEIMMVRCGTINFEDIKKPSAYIKMLGDILK